MCDVLVDLDEEEGRAEQPGQDEAEFEAAAVAAADRLQRVVDREARGDEDRGVDAGDRDREFERFRRPGRRVDDDPEEEVGGEERPEQHDLGDDEEEDPERLAVDPRALVGLRRPVMLLGVAVPERYRCALHQASSPSATAAATASAARPTSRCSTGFSVISRTRPIRSSSSQRDCSPAEGRDQDLVDAVVLDRVLHREEGVGAHRLARSRRCRRGRARPGSRRGRATTWPRGRPRPAGR